MRPPPGATPAACCPAMHHPIRLWAEGRRGEWESESSGSREGAVPGKKGTKMESQCQACPTAGDVQAPHLSSPPQGLTGHPTTTMLRQQNQAKPAPVFLSYPFHRVPLSFISSHAFFLPLSPSLHLFLSLSLFPAEYVCVAPVWNTGVPYGLCSLKNKTRLAKHCVGGLGCGPMALCRRC